METVATICRFLEEFAPSRLAEEWDNVGLLVGDANRPVATMMTCLTVTPESVAEAVAENVDLIVTHHPMPFRPLKKITADTAAGAMLLDLIGNRIAVYSPHTAFDSAAEGINRRLAELLELQEVRPLVPAEDEPDDLGSGRQGTLSTETALSDVVARLKEKLRLTGLHIVGASDQPVRRVAVACGSAGEFLAAADREGCDLFITGETNFHTCLDARARNIAMILTGHYASERFAVEQLAAELQRQFAGLKIWPSKQETDPLEWK